MKSVKNVSIKKGGFNLRLKTLKELDAEYQDVDFLLMTPAYEGIREDGDKYKIYELQYSRGEEVMPTILALYNHSIDYIAGVSYSLSRRDLLTEVYDVLNAYFDYIKKPLGYKVDKKCMLLSDLGEIRFVRDYEIINSNNKGELLVKIQTEKKGK